MWEINVRGSEEAIKHEQSRGTGNTGTLHGMTYKQQTKNTTQENRKMSNTSNTPPPSHKKLGVGHVLAKIKQFLSLMRQLSCYSK